MKTAIFKKLLFTLVLFLNVLLATAQDKFDTVFMADGEKKEGRIVSMNSNAVKFVHKGETLEYEFLKSEISKITFASGRTEVMKNPGIVAAASTTASERKGKIAVLPFDFITNDPSLSADAMAQQMQNDLYNSLKENTTRLEYQDPITTNSILIKQGLTRENLKSKSPKEMAELLGVENVVYGIANVTQKGTSTFGSGSSTYSGKETDKKEGRKETTKATGTAYGSSNATTMTNYETKVDLSFYNDQGTNIYSESRNSFGSGFDAYHATFNYLVKRCPFGTKAKK